MSIKVTSQASHRNGSGGDPFVVSLFEWATEDAHGGFVAVSFGDTRNEFIERTAVLNIAELAKGDSTTYRADVPHAIENLGKGEATVFLVVIYQ